MKLNLNQENKQMIATMLENGSNNGRISLKFPGIRKDQIDKIRAEINKGTEQTKKLPLFDIEGDAVEGLEAAAVSFAQIFDR